MKFRISSEYGVLEEVRDGLHTGIDLAMPEGTELRSIFEGTVIQVFDGTTAIGKGVKILSENGKEIIYGHMGKVNVEVGEKVNVGELIGLSGNTGNSTGPHLHFGMKENGVFVDPTNYIEKVDALSGSSLITAEGPLTTIIKETVVDTTKETIKESVMNFLIATGEILLELLDSIVLIGSGVFIILRVAGLDKGYKYAGITFASYVLIKFLIGG